MAITQLRSPDLKVVCLADAIVERYEDSERRGHVRLSASDVRWLRSARLKYGPDVRVLDISADGILVETDGQLRPDANIVFELSGPTNSILMPSKVLRCRVASFGDVMRYQGACSFKRPLEIPDLLEQAIAKSTGTTAATAARQPGTAASWQKVVARFRDGRLVRGYTADFHPSKPQLHLSAEPHSSDTLFLQLSQLKALFFVRDFTGDQARVDRQEFGLSAAGTQGGRHVQRRRNAARINAGLPRGGARLLRASCRSAIQQSAGLRRTGRDGAGAVSVTTTALGNSADSPEF